MKQKRILVSKLLFTAWVKGENETEARRKVRKELFKRKCYLINGSFRIEARQAGDGLFICDVLNNYFVEQLGFRDGLRNFLTVLNAATLNIGVTTRILEIE